MRFVVAYEYRNANGVFQAMSEQDIELKRRPETKDDPTVAFALAAKIVIPAGQHVVITELRPA